MSRYIDADEVKKRLLSYYDCVNESTTKDNYRGETLMSYEVADMIEDCIENTQTADVQEVRHGRWNTVNSKVTQCSVCGVIRVSRDIRTQVGWNFCPVCGAKMDEEVEDGRG